MIKTLPIWLLVLPCIYCTEKETIEKQAKDSLNDALNHAAFAIIEFTVGGIKISHGDVLSGSLVIGHGILDLSKSCHEFKEAKELFDQSRDFNHD